MAERRYAVILGAGADDMFLQVFFSVTQVVVNPENIASAVGFITLAQFVGIAISLAIANAILLNNSQDKIQQILPDISSADIQAAILGSRSGVVQKPAPELKARVVDAIASTIGSTYVLCIAGGALVVVMSLAMPHKKLFGVAAGIAAS